MRSAALYETHPQVVGSGGGPAPPPAVDKRLHFPRNDALVLELENSELLAALLPALNEFKCLEFSVIKPRRSPWVKAYCRRLYHPAGPWGSNRFKNAPGVESGARFNFRSNKVPTIYKNLKKCADSDDPRLQALMHNPVHRELYQALDDYYSKEQYVKQAVKAFEEVVSKEVNKPKDCRVADPTNIKDIVLAACSDDRAELTEPKAEPPANNTGEGIIDLVDEESTPDAENVSKTTETTAGLSGSKRDNSSLELEASSRPNTRQRLEIGDISVKANKEHVEEKDKENGASPAKADPHEKDEDANSVYSLPNPAANARAHDDNKEDTNVTTKQQSEVSPLNDNKLDVNNVGTALHDNQNDNRSMRNGGPSESKQEHDTNVAVDGNNSSNPNESNNNNNIAEMETDRLASGGNRDEKTESKQGDDVGAVSDDKIKNHQQKNREDGMEAAPPVDTITNTAASFDSQKKKLEAKIKHLQDQMQFWKPMKDGSKEGEKKYKKLEKKLIKASDQLGKLLGIDSDTASDTDDE